MIEWQEERGCHFLEIESIGTIIDICKGVGVSKQKWRVTSEAFPWLFAEYHIKTPIEHVKRAALVALQDGLKEIVMELPRA